MVSAAPYEGASAVETASIGLRIHPSLWNSVPAKVFYVMLAVLLVAILLRMFTTSVRLRNGIKMEQDLNDVKVRFFTNISHELRTPLTLILGGIDEVSKNTPAGDRNEYSVNMVYKNAKRMMTLVNSVATRKMTIPVRCVTFVWNTPVMLLMRNTNPTVCLSTE